MIYEVLGTFAWFAQLYVLKIKAPLPGQLALPLSIAVLLLWLGFLYVCLIILVRTRHWWIPAICLFVSIGIVIVGIGATKAHDALMAGGTRTEG